MALSQLDLNFLKMASLLSQRDPYAMATKKSPQAKMKRHRGCIIAKGDQKISEGMSQHLGGLLYKPQTEERYVAIVNAEIAALGEALKRGFNPLGVSVYSSDCPNWHTFKTLVALGIKRIIFFGPVRNPRISHYAQELGVEVIGVA